MVLVDGVFRLCRLQSARDGMTSEKQSVGQLRANPTDSGVGLGGQLSGHQNLFLAFA